MEGGFLGDTSPQLDPPLGFFDGGQMGGMDTDGMGALIRSRNSPLKNLYNDVASGAVTFDPANFDTLLSDEDGAVSAGEFATFSPAVQAWARANPQQFVSTMIANRNSANGDLASLGAEGGYRDLGAVTPTGTGLDYSNAGYLDVHDDNFGDVLSQYGGSIASAIAMSMGLPPVWAGALGGAVNGTREGGFNNILKGGLTGAPVGYLGQTVGPMFDNAVGTSLNGLPDAVTAGLRGAATNAVKGGVGSALNGGSFTEGATRGALMGGVPTFTGSLVNSGLSSEPIQNLIGSTATDFNPDAYNPAIADAIWSDRASIDPAVSDSIWGDHKAAPVTPYSPVNAYNPAVADAIWSETATIPPETSDALWGEGGAGITPTDSYNPAVADAIWSSNATIPPETSDALWGEGGAGLSPPDGYYPDVADRVWGPDAALPPQSLADAIWSEDYSIDPAVSDHLFGGTGSYNPDSYKNSEYAKHDVPGKVANLTNTVTSNWVNDALNPGQSNPPTTPTPTYTNPQGLAGYTDWADVNGFNWQGPRNYSLLGKKMSFNTGNPFGAGAEEYGFGSTFRL